MFRMFLRHGSIINYSSLDSSCFMFYDCVHDLLGDKTFDQVLVDGVVLRVKSKEIPGKFANGKIIKINIKSLNH